MTISSQEFETILDDHSKVVNHDIVWNDDEDHSPAREFRAVVDSGSGWPLFIVGRFNSFAGTLSFALIHRGFGRIYALDLGADHHNPDCHCIGEKHKHRWQEGFRDKNAYVPDDITAPWDRPQQVWKEFCAEANLQHRGNMHLPHDQGELGL